MVIASLLKKHLPSKRLYDTKQDTDAISVPYHSHTVLRQPLTLRMGQARHVVSARGDVDTRSTLVEPVFPSRNKKNPTLINSMMMIGCTNFILNKLEREDPLLYEI